MSRAGPRHAVAFVALLCLAALAPAGVSAATDVSGVGPVQRAAETPAENDTVRHENPEEVNDGNLDDTQAWLVGRISARLGGSTVNLSRSQYESARGLLGNETRDLLEKYVDVAGETEGEEDDQMAETLNETIERQRNFTESTRNFSRLYAEYREARRNGNETRARRLARRLLELERRLNRTARRLTENYRRISNATGRDTARIRSMIRSRAENATEQAAEIREAVFVETRLRVLDASTDVSFVDPLVVRARLTTANGTAIPNATVAVLEPSRRSAATTNATGYVTLRYRPIALPVDATAVLVEYLPDPESSFLGSVAAVNVSVTQVRPKLEVSELPSEVGFGGDVGATVRVRAAGQSLDGIPLVVSLGGFRMDQGRTEGGEATLSARLPATIDDGTRRLRVAVAMEGRAIAPASVTRQVRVVETPTRLSIDASRAADGRVRITGRLTARGGTPLGDRVVRLSIDGEGAGRALTNADGRFEAVLSPPEGAGLLRGGNLSVPVAGTFDAPATNLESSRARTRVVLPGGGGGVAGFGLPAWAWLGVGFLVLVVAGGTYAVLSGRGEEDSPTPAEGGAQAGSSRTGAVEGSAESTAEPLVALARERLADGATDDAVRIGYEAARATLAATVDAGGRTHWEFYRACGDAGIAGDRLRALRRLTEHYERAAFAPETLSAETAREALGLVGVFSEPEARDGGTPADD